jgi:hypothetical protein
LNIPGNIFATEALKIIAEGIPVIAEILRISSCSSLLTGTEILSATFKEYTLADIQKYTEELGKPDGSSITTTICVQGWAEDFGLAFSQEDCERVVGAEDWEAEIFKAACERLLRRITSADHAEAAKSGGAA